MSYADSSETARQTLLLKMTLLCVKSWFVTVSMSCSFLPYRIREVDLGAPFTIWFCPV